MSNTIIDLLEKRAPLGVTGINNLAEEVRALAKAAGTPTDQARLEEAARETGELVEAVTVLLKALEIASEDDAQVVTEWIRAARGKYGDEECGGCSEEDCVELCGKE